MTMLLQILAHTPRWVFILFAVLVWYGAKQLFAGTVSLTKITIMPIAMTGLAIYGVAGTFGDSPMALVGWAAAAVVLLAILIRRPLPAATRFDAPTRTFHVVGSAVPLMLMMGIFFTKYVVGVSIAMHPELRHVPMFAIGVPVLYGAFSGIFLSRGLRLWKLAIRQESSQAAPAAA